MSVDSRIKNLVDSSGEEHTLNFWPAHKSFIKDLFAIDSK